MVCLLNMDKLTVREGADLGFSRSGGGGALLGTFIPQNYHILAPEGPLEKFQGPFVTKYGYLKIVQRGSLWVGRGSNP